MSPTYLAETLRLGPDGAERRTADVARHLRDIEAALTGLPSDQAGVRIQGAEHLRDILNVDGVVGALAAQILGPAVRPVRAVLFDKSPTANWSLGWHQDRTICVETRRDSPGFGPWSVKAGMQHVAPPFDLLTRMLTVRVHLDDVPADNAPLLIAPGSHLKGRVPLDRIEEVVKECGVFVCEAEAGDVWLYSTPILHASSAADTPKRRRVLQIDYSAEKLPGGLRWLGV
ncbi:MAG: phytanoyl-CoA dioxygenase family protein [Candidatus Brevundimonas colombiensis]|uniref:Phytanoyl-CoA dioxygenase family protein n=1 Tax=Candidatus Brevundimonas colombiensis TaxID=3121376 RepID=A0AAJ5X2C9_9CAUL|nr:phytanoyl-CoA dioxygenase family protein [Brevundimonas sp.]WEK38925.1 MAG: phytanoyl-CoA dioxygenase family protein [Brevundimonas sp.]